MIHPPQEQNVVPGRRIAVVGVAAIVATAAGAFVAYGIGSCRTRELATEGQAAQGPAIPADVHGMETRVFTVEAQGLDTHEQAEAQLTHYGWVDRDRGIVHVPIDVAFALYLSRERGTP